jgi:hypothetical protein
MSNIWLFVDDEEYTRGAEEVATGFEVQYTSAFAKTEEPKFSASLRVRMHTWQPHPTQSRKINHLNAKFNTLYLYFILLHIAYI